MRRNVWLVMVLAAVRAVAESGPSAAVSEPDFRFSQVVSGAVVQHEYALKNNGSAPLRVEKARMTFPLRATQMPAIVLPGEEAVLRFQLETAQLDGLFQGEIVVITDDPANSETRLTFQGDVIPPIQILPLPAFFVASQRGVEKSSHLDILNHLAEPLEILRVENPSSRFKTELETLKPGRHYRVWLTLQRDAPPGRAKEIIRLATSSPTHPELKIPANTLVKERVYTFPDEIDFGLISASRFKAQPELLGRLSKILMIYQAGGNDFQISIRTDVPFLQLRPERSPFQDRYQIEVSIIPGNLKSGSVDGSIVITTNDTEFPLLVVPVKAAIEGSW